MTLYSIPHTSYIQIIMIIETCCSRRCRLFKIIFIATYCIKIKKKTKMIWILFSLKNFFCYHRNNSIHNNQKYYYLLIHRLFWIFINYLSLIQYFVNEFYYDEKWRHHLDHYHYHHYVHVLDYSFVFLWLIIQKKKVGYTNS